MAIDCTKIISKAIFYAEINTLNFSSAVVTSMSDSTDIIFVLPHSTDVNCLSMWNDFHLINILLLAYLFVVINEKNFTTLKKFANQIL